LETSQSYRSLLRSKEFQQNENSSDSLMIESNSSSSISSTFIDEKIWHLAEIFYLSDPVQIDRLFFEWYKQHYDFSDSFFLKCESITHPQNQPEYWPLVYQYGRERERETDRKKERKKERKRKRGREKERKREKSKRKRERERERIIKHLFSFLLFCRSFLQGDLDQGLVLLSKHSGLAGGFGSFDINQGNSFRIVFDALVPHSPNEISIVTKILSGDQATLIEYRYVFVLFFVYVCLFVCLRSFFCLFYLFVCLCLFYFFVYVCLMFFFFFFVVKIGCC